MRSLPLLLLACQTTAPIEVATSVSPWAEGDSDADTDADTDTDADSDSDADTDTDPPGATCVDCHRDGVGPLEDAHPWGPPIACTTCHGGLQPAGTSEEAHVPRPPMLGSDADLEADEEAWHRYRTLWGIAAVAPWPAQNPVWEGLDYLQFRNPGDLQVVRAGRSCGTGGCHDAIVGGLERSVHATEPHRYAVDARIGARDTNLPVADTEPVLTYADLTPLGSAPSLEALAAWSSQGQPNGPFAGFTVAEAEAGLLPATHRVATYSALHQILQEGFLGTGDANSIVVGGWNLRAGSFRSGGCSACHVRYDTDGRAALGDLTTADEPTDPDSLEAPERPHPFRHRMVSRADVAVGVGVVGGIRDTACAVCHASLEDPTFLTWAGVRLDPAMDVVNDTQYPLPPADQQTLTPGQAPWFPPTSTNSTWNGWAPEQLVEHEDYDDDGRDDTPQDAHREAGMSCIDCHRSSLHGDGSLAASSAHANTVHCEDCHGDVDGLPGATDCDGPGVEDCAFDRDGRALDHVRWNPNGDELYVHPASGGPPLRVPLVRDVVYDTGATDAVGNPYYNPRASYAMGRVDLFPQNGAGPYLLGDTDPGFAHQDTVGCVACHAAWQPSSAARRVTLRYDGNPAGVHLEPVNGERTVVRREESWFYGSPLPFYLQVGSEGLLAPGFGGPATFVRYVDASSSGSSWFAFSDSNGFGRSTASLYPALDRRTVAPHSIRGAQTADAEGVRPCIACHLTADSNAAADDFTMRVDYGTRDWSRVPDALRSDEASESARFLRMAVGYGSELYTFDANGCPVNALDEATRPGCNTAASNTQPVVYALDRLVDPSGIVNVALPQAIVEDRAPSPAREGPLAGPLSPHTISTLVDQTLTGWLDTEGNPQGNAADVVTF